MEIIEIIKIVGILLLIPFLCLVGIVFFYIGYMLMFHKQEFQFGAIGMMMGIVFFCTPVIVYLPFEQEIKVFMENKSHQPWIIAFFVLMLVVIIYSAYKKGHFKY